jgi:hypothetical protein
VAPHLANEFTSNAPANSSILTSSSELIAPFPFNESWAESVSRHKRPWFLRRCGSYSLKYES